MNDREKVWAAGVAGLLGALMMALRLRRRRAKHREVVERRAEASRKGLRADIEPDEIERLLTGLKELEERADDLEDMAGDLLEQARSTLRSSGTRRDEKSADEDEDGDEEDE